MVLRIRKEERDGETDFPLIEWICIGSWQLAVGTSTPGGLTKFLCVLKGLRWDGGGEGGGKITKWSSLVNFT